MSEERPSYPPARVWSFPPPEVGRHWFWIAIGAMVAALVTIVGLVVVSVVLFSRDSPGIINDPTVLSTIDRECTQMTQDVDQLASRQGAVTSDTIRRQNTVVERMIERVSALPRATLDGDEPTRLWLEDWQSLVEARADFADGDVEELRVPRTADGDPITTRMEDALLDPVCPVPVELTDPGARNQSDI